MLKSTPYPSEREPTYINLMLSQTETKDDGSGSDVYFVVRGTVYVIETNTEMEFDKQFDSKEDALQYFADMKKAFPVSTISMKKHISIDIKYYG